MSDPFVRISYLEEQLEEERADKAKLRRERDVLKEIIVAASGPEKDTQRLNEIFRMLEASS